ncbi:MAG: diaminopimelate decarboxylase [Treponema sp.]|jgi:diaminopimelate decarboxylase|nr:diaminopimelate decarboxylase [Treponema sp.]
MPERLTPEQAYVLVSKYGSPLYVYDERLVRERCREISSLVSLPFFVANYSAKANTNIELLKIIRSEGLHVDAMSPGEILAETAAGFQPDEIFFIPNNVSIEELRFATERGIMISLDSLSQLEQYGKAKLSRRVAFRLNPGMGVGHSHKVVTGGKSKFGIETKDVYRVQELATRYGLSIVGVNQHIGSLFLQSNEYLQAAATLFKVAAGFPELAFLDLGGGFGIPYHGEARLDLDELGQKLTRMIQDFISTYGREITIMVEPGRYICAESGTLLGTVHSVKENFGETYVGTDIGFNMLMRPILYDSWHDIWFLTASTQKRQLTITGNICESGDILARNRELPLPTPGDLVCIANVGAYGYSMASNYNLRLRPAEVLIDINGQDRLIRYRDTYQALIQDRLIIAPPT